MSAIATSKHHDEIRVHAAEPSKIQSDNEEDFDAPIEFSLWRKWTMTVSLAFTTLTVTFSSSVWSSTIAITSEEFRVHEWVMILGISLFVLGFAVGPTCWAPFSELKGRRLPLFGGFVAFAIMQIPIACSHNLTAILLCRFLAGCFGAAPLVLVSAVYADIWAPADRGIASAFYASAVYSGPTLGPIIGSFITTSRLGWRWTAWVTLIMAACTGSVAFFVVRETHIPTLRRRAIGKRVAAEQSTATFTDTSERQLSPGFRDILPKYISKPVALFIHEPMLMVLTLYISIVYAILYLTLYAYPYSFSHQRGWDARIGALPFLAILIGIIVASISMVFYTKMYYQPRLLARGSVLPEDRLPPMVIGGILLPVGLFCFAWTSSPTIIWVPQVLSGALIGMGIMLVFSSGVAIVLDIYLVNAASAIAANTCVRSFVAAGLPLAAPRMFSDLGTAWATSILGFLCVCLIPVPFMFYRYGTWLRQKSKYAVSLATA